MFHPTLKLSQLLDNHSSNGRIFFNIIQVGTGGTGGYLVQRLSKLLYALSQNSEYHFKYTLIDGDQVESSNLMRQPFIEEDLLQPKAQVLAERYEAAYDIPILYRPAYIENAKELTDLIYSEGYTFALHVPVLLGCVDNNATRQIMDDVFNEVPNMIYIDSGIDAMDTDRSIESGYSGQVVCGVKFNDRKYLGPVGEVYPNILEDMDTRLPTQACGQQMVYYPQRMQTNEVAASVMMGYLNTLLSDYEIVSHYTNFNARTMNTRPTYLAKEQVTK
ncbi:ThiF family adenylyltransferase [Priestia megaterium]